MSQYALLPQSRIPSHDPIFIESGVSNRLHLRLAAGVLAVADVNRSIPRLYHRWIMERPGLRLLNVARPFPSAAFIIGHRNGERISSALGVVVNQNPTPVFERD